MKIEVVVIPADENQFNQLYPLTDQSEMKRLIDEFEKYPVFGTKEFLYVGYYILNGQFGIVHIPEAKHIGDALVQAYNKIILPEINKYYKPKDTVENVAKEN